MPGAIVSHRFWGLWNPGHSVKETLAEGEKEEIREILQTIAQSTLSTTSAAEAVKTRSHQQQIGQIDSPTSSTTRHRMKSSRYLGSGHG